MANEREYLPQEHEHVTELGKTCWCGPRVEVIRPKERDGEQS